MLLLTASVGPEEGYWFESRVKSSLYTTPVKSPSVLQKNEGRFHQLHSNLGQDFTLCKASAK